MRLSYLLRLLVAAILLAIPLNAQTWNVPAAALAEKVVPHVQARSAAALEIENRSSITAGEVANVRRAVETELRMRGLALVPAERAVETIKLTLSQNAQGYMWVARVGDAVVMATAPLLPVPAGGAGSLVLRKTLLWSQPDRILDVAQLDPATLLILDEHSISLYSQIKGQWQQQGSVPLELVFPRDLRGRLAIRADLSFTAYLPGVSCAGAVQPQFRAECRAGYAWPLTNAVSAGFGHLNAFTGELVPPLGSKEKLPAFYSAAPVQHAEDTGWLLALMDGHTRLIGPNGETLATFGGSGSDLATVQSGCGAGSQVLATRPSDPAGPDGIQAFEITAREPVEAAPALEFPGPVTALWTAADGRSATAVINNLKTGKYEAYSLTVTCGR